MGWICVTVSVKRRSPRMSLSWMSIDFTEIIFYAFAVLLLNSMCNISIDIVTSHLLGALSTVGKRNYFTRLIPYFTTCKFCNSMTWTTVCSIFCTNSSLSLHCYCFGWSIQQLQEVREVGFRSPWSSSAYPQCKVYGDIWKHVSRLIRY